MKLLYFFESIRNPVFDFFFSMITHIGEETVFLAFAIIFFWCVNKREGYYILITGLVGTVVNQILKLAFRIPRPWVKDPSFTIVESAREQATGYSFPSGHTQNVAGTFGCVAAFSAKKYVSIASITVIALVSLSRMYLGVHTPLDVCVSLVFAALLVFLLRPIFSDEERFSCFMPFVVVASCVLSLIFVLYVLLLPDKDMLDPHNLQSGMKNAFTLLGCTAGLVVVYIVDSRYIKFETNGRWYAQLIKLAIGLGVVFAIKAGLSAPLVALFKNEYIARAVRYFMIVVFAGAVWPLSFKFFSRMQISALDRLSEKIKTFCKN